VKCVCCRFPLSRRLTSSPRVPLMVAHESLPGLRRI